MNNHSQKSFQDIENSNFKLNNNKLLFENKNVKMNSEIFINNNSTKLDNIEMLQNYSSLSSPLYVGVKVKLFSIFKLF